MHRVQQIALMADQLVLESPEPRETIILLLCEHYNLIGPLSLQEIADLFNMSRERVRQIEDKAHLKLHHPKLARRLQIYEAGTDHEPTSNLC